MNYPQDLEAWNNDNICSAPESAVWSGLTGYCPPPFYSVNWGCLKARSVTFLKTNADSYQGPHLARELDPLFVATPHYLGSLTTWCLDFKGEFPEKECQWEPYNLGPSLRSHTTSTLLHSIQGHGHKILSWWGNSEVPEELIRSQILLWPFLQNKIYHRR